MIRVAVAGATGRMGSLAVELINDSAELKLHAELSSSSALDRMVGADVLIDFTSPEVSPELVHFAISSGLKVVVGTSGWSETKVAGLEKLVSEANNGSAVLIVPNFSIGSMLAQRFAAQAARVFSSVEIIEAHHAGKIDSPSGTAIRTAELISAARDQTPLIAGVDQPARGQVVAGVPIHSLRQPGVSASQQVIFGGDAEQLTVSHTVISHRAYAQGILLALTASQSQVGVRVGLDHLIDHA
jgi:4-hydroxy-tetrahydrodipicolinate reductase